MIDTKELRKLAQAASHPTTKGRWMRLFGERTVYDRMEDGCRGILVVSTDKHPPSPFEAACLDFIAAANPAAVSELLDRLEAAEKERDSYKLAFIEYSEKTEWVQRGVNDGTVSAKYLGWHRADVMSDLLSAAEKERDALRAKIEAMERQEPVACVWRCDNGHIHGSCEQTLPMGAKLYALPGAKGEEK